MSSPQGGAKGPLAGSAEARRVYLEAADTLLERFDADTSLQAIVDLAVPVLADWCFIHLVAAPHPRIVAVANEDPTAAADARARAATTHPLSPDTAVARVLAGGPSELVQVSDATLRAAAVDDEHLAALRSRAFRSAVVAPLLGREGVLGAVTFAMTDSGRVYELADLEMLAKLARRAGIALDNARLFAAERAAREAAERAQDRIARLQQLTEKLSSTVEQAAVVRVMVDSGRTALGAAAGFAWLLVGDDAVELVASVDPEDTTPVDQRYVRFPLSTALPICEAIRTRQPMMFENLSAMLGAFPDAVPRHASRFHAWAVVPFVAAGRALGGVSFSFTAERAFSDDDRMFLSAMTTQAALALERAQLVAAERAVTNRFAASEENLRVALVAGRAAAWSLDLETMRGIRDRSYFELTGVTEVNSVGDYQIIHPDDRHIAREAFERTLREHVPYTPEVRILRGDGRYMWTRSYGRLIYGTTGKPVTLSGVMVDIDEAKQASLRAEHESEVNETLHRLAAEFASVLDHDALVGRIVDEVAKLIDAEVGAFVEGETPADATTEGFEWLVVPVIGPTGTRYGTLRFANRKPRTFTAEQVRLVANISTHASVALENARLYREMQQREAELELAVEAARVANHRKDEFLAMLGHELRNPVAPIVTALDLVEAKTGALDREHRAIRRHVDHLRRLIDDLLDVSRIANGKLHLEKKRIDLGETIAQAIEMVAPLVHERGQVVKSDVGSSLAVDGDPARLVQVFSNLLRNASKYSDPGTAIHVRATATAGAIQIDVRDEGIGLTPELRGAMFDLFVQGERSLARSEGGLGIGLSVARMICEAHGGAISAASEGLGRGSTFTVTIPRASELAAPTPSSDPAKARARILVVDDNVDAALMLHELFESLGHQSAVAHDGFAALELARAFEPNVAVLDIGLPNMDGYELARRLRQLREVRLVALTGYDSEEDRAKSREAGFDHHLAKPLQVEQLLRLIDVP